MEGLRTGKDRDSAEATKPETIRNGDTEAFKAPESVEPGEQAAAAQNERSDQVNKLVSEIKNGNSDLLPALWEAVENFIRFKASRRMKIMLANDTQPLRGNELDDYVQQGFLALMDAIEGFDPENGANFTTYLWYHLKRAFREVDGIRTAKRDGLHKADSLNEQAYNDDEKDSGEKIYTVPDPVAEDAYLDIENRIFNEDLHKALLKAVDALPLVKREIIKARYFEGRTQKEIADSRGVSAERVRQNEREALREMRRKAKITGIDAFVEMHTIYYRTYSVTHMNRTQTSPVEAVVFDRERLRSMWIADQKYTVI